MPSIDIRTIKKREADDFLTLLCKVFELDPSRARHVFYKEPMFDLSRKWALFKDGEMTTILTTTPLQFGWGQAFGIAGVATDPNFRGQGLAQRLIEKVIEHGASSGEAGCILFAHKEEVYRRAGFETVDTVVKGEIKVSPDLGPVDILRFSEVKSKYDAWAKADEGRLLRNERRWKYWKWILRTCEAAPGGYVCVEPSLCREAVIEKGLEEWPVMPGTSWFGLKSLTDALEVPLSTCHHDLYLMARAMPRPPQMFMTDQF